MKKLEVAKIMNYRIGRNLEPPIFSKKRGEGAKLSHKILRNLIKENKPNSN